ncbi:F-box protein CPR1-like [Euphorbia lathyris]|uniref:F-box protein CPR1-like n=1 Tax=Euphorbia lathyris TaxID=212925 RepID=UPI0033134436
MTGGSNMTISNYIPDDVIVDILSKLPSRSVLKFKSVCKRWHSLISDPVFLKIHFNQPSRNPKLLFSIAGSQIQVLDYENQLFNDSCLSGPLKFPGETCLKHAKVVGSSCGLVCVATNSWGNTFSIWNPLTGVCRKIPRLSCQVSNKYYFHGLGYDSVNNDLKLVISMDRRITCNLFSLKANSWKTIPCPLAMKYYHPGPVPEPLYAILPWNSLATVLKGIFHWLVVANLNNECEIVAFDSAKETFQKLKLPVNAPLKSSVVSLFEHRESLCVSFSKTESCHVKDIWMMKECGSWAHFLTVKNSPLVDCFRLPVLCISPRNEVVYHSDRQFSRCGREEEGKLDEISIQQCVYGAVLYVETLMSPYDINPEVGLQLSIKRKREGADPTQKSRNRVVSPSLRM